MRKRHGKFIQSSGGYISDKWGNGREETRVTINGLMQKAGSAECIVTGKKHM